MFVILLIVTLVISPSINATAQQLEQYKNLSLQQRKDYEFVIQTCRMDLASFATLLQATKKDTLDYFEHSFEPPSNIPQKDNIYTRKGLGKYVHRLIQSDGFSLGLKTCFPKNEKARNQYTANLLMLDAYGKLATISIMTVTGAALYRTLGFLGKKIAVAPTVAAFKKLNASEAFVKKVPRYMGRGGTYAFNAAMIAALANYIYEVRKDQKITKTVYSEDTEALRKDLERNLDLYYHTVELQTHAPTAAEKMAMEALVQEQRETVLFYLDSLLQQKNLDSADREELIVLRDKFQPHS